MSRFSILGCLTAASCLVQALEITQGLEEDPGCADAGDLRLLQVKLSLQRSETADDGTWKASVVAAAAQSAQSAQTGGVVSTSLPQLQMRYQKVSPADLAWAAKEKAIKQDALREIVAADVEISSGLGSNVGGEGMARPEHHAEWIQFSDEDPRKGFVKGTIEVGPAANESDVTHYNIFWASNQSTMDLIIALPKGIYQHHLASESDGTLGVPIPAGANQLVVKTSNAAGIMDGPGVWTSVFDIWRPPLKQLLKGLLRG